MTTNEPINPALLSELTAQFAFKIGMTPAQFVAVIGPALKEWMIQEWRLVKRLADRPDC
jgi:hypothetical protein